MMINRIIYWIWRGQSRNKVEDGSEKTREKNSYWIFWMKSFFSDLKKESSRNMLSKPWFDPKEITVVFVLGRPGSGKGTQCAQLVRDYDFVHLSAGDLLRQEQARPGSGYANMIQQSMQNGQIVPMHVTISLLKNEMIQSVTRGKKRFLIDGFPRKIDQMLAFEKNVCPCQFTLDFHCSESILIERLLARGRRDDNIDTIQKRFKTHQELTVPVIEYMEKQGKLVRVTCENSIESTYQETLDQIRPFLKLS